MAKLKQVKKSPCLFLLFCALFISAIVIAILVIFYFFFMFPVGVLVFPVSCLVCGFLLFSCIILCLVVFRLLFSFFLFTFCFVLSILLFFDARVDATPPLSFGWPYVLGVFGLLFYAVALPVSLSAFSDALWVLFCLFAL